MRQDKARLNNKLQLRISGALFTCMNTPLGSFRIGGLKLALILVVATAWPLPKAGALTIIRDFIGGSQGTNDIGNGDLTAIFNTAADIWEQAVHDDFTLTLHYGWAPVGGGQHSLEVQGGTPNRETEGTILFNNDNVSGHFHWYLDPTPRDNLEFTTFTNRLLDLGGGNLSVSRTFSGAGGDAGNFAYSDLLTVALEMIGHALGLGQANTSFQVLSTNLHIVVTAPLPFPGTVIGLRTNFFGVTSRIITDDQYPSALMDGHANGDRQMPAAVDILVIAQISQFTNVNVDLMPRPQIQAAGTNGTISWTELWPGFRLEQNPALNAPAGWTAVSQTATATNELRNVTLPIDRDRMFFRIREF